MWQRLTRIFIREGVAPWVYYFLFKSVVQLVLLLGTETWGVTPCMGQVLEGVSGPVGVTVDRDAPADTAWWKMGVHLGGGGKRGGEFRGNGGINLDKAEHGCAVHSYTIDSVPV